MWMVFILAFIVEVKKKNKKIKKYIKLLDFAYYIEGRQRKGTEEDKRTWSLRSQVKNDEEVFNVTSDQIPKGDTCSLTSQTSRPIKVTLTLTYIMS